MKKICMLNEDGYEIYLALRDIYFIEARGHSIVVSLISKKIICKESIQDIFMKVKDDGFCMTHRSYLVNLSHVDAEKKYEIIMRNGVKVPVSRNRYNGFKKSWFSWNMEHANG